jgi:hypothetical protein
MAHRDRTAWLVWLVYLALNLDISVVDSIGDAETARLALYVRVTRIELLWGF